MSVRSSIGSYPLLLPTLKGRSLHLPLIAATLNCLRVAVEWTFAMPSQRQSSLLLVSIRCSLISLLPWIWLGLWLGHDARFNALLPLAAAQAPPASCPNVADQQFVVVVTTNTSLGLRLSERLEILEFIADESGRSRAVEASGLAEIGDRLVAVNNVSLAALPFRDALQQLKTATVPKHLRFQSGDGRCFVDSCVTNQHTLRVNATVNDGVLTVSPTSQEFDQVVRKTDVVDGVGVED
ncbi:hypothetical protein PINS_up003895 [Pythium insidiosum]|nr:hypothetical protein PINS_up003895 [Pythium insidiosum]